MKNRVQSLAIHLIRILLEDEKNKPTKKSRIQLETSFLSLSHVWTNYFSLIVINRIMFHARARQFSVAHKVFYVGSIENCCVLFHDFINKSTRNWTIKIPTVVFYYFQCFCKFYSHSVRLFVAICLILWNFCSRIDE